ncbi:MAG: peptide chain release factor N(5)-glutamine methyltransferase [Eubacteriales bacterium]|nr:peptide chain release factor N(5)-glutamine methyltransferase [Eubacteriales bacterium]
MTIHEALQHARTLLEQATVPDPEQDALLMLSYLTGYSPMETRLHAGQALTDQQEQRLTSLLLSRTQRQPLQYLLQEQWFYGLRFYVDHRVLIPRQETEALCELGLQHIARLSAPAVLDLCTGSGAIAVTVKHECPQAEVCATDLSKDALEVAKRNSESNHAPIRLMQGDLFQPVGAERFDLILTNPPYIESTACRTLQPEVKNEPLLALDGGEDGLDFYRRIAREAHLHLTCGGLIAAEVGDGQAQAVAQLLTNSGFYDKVEIRLDLYGVQRIVSAHATATPT